MTITSKLRCCRQAATSGLGMRRCGVVRRRCWCLVLSTRASDRIDHFASDDDDDDDEDDGDDDDADVCAFERSLFENGISRVLATSIRF